MSLSPKQALANYRESMGKSIQREVRLFNELPLADRLELLFRMLIATNMATKIVADDAGIDVGAAMGGGESEH